MYCLDALDWPPVEHQHRNRRALVVAGEPAALRNSLLQPIVSFRLLEFVEVEHRVENSLLARLTCLASTVGAL